MILSSNQQKKIKAKLTTEHPISSYGQPVIVLETTNEALDAFSWMAGGYRVVRATSTEIRQLKRLGLLE